MNRTRIDWATHVFNPVVGCTGSCPYCYARKMAHRFHRDFTPHWVEKNFQQPVPRKPGARIFVNSMSDVADWEPLWLARVDVRAWSHPEHTFFMLSKRPWKLAWVKLSSNTMLGYSATDQPSWEALLEQDFRNVSFLSIEPLLGPINLKLYDRRPALRWIIVGSETGNRKGRVVPRKEWLEEIHTFAWKYYIPLFFKESLRGLWPAGPFPQEYPA